MPSTTPGTACQSNGARLGRGKVTPAERLTPIPQPGRWDCIKDWPRGPVHDDCGPVVLLSRIASLAPLRPVRCRLLVRTGTGPLRTAGQPVLAAAIASPSASSVTPGPQNDERGSMPAGSLSAWRCPSAGVTTSAGGVGAPAVLAEFSPDVRSSWTPVTCARWPRGSPRSPKICSGPSPSGTRSTATTKLRTPT